jgi:hypothetical protein
MKSHLVLYVNNHLALTERIHMASWSEMWMCCRAILYIQGPAEIPDDFAKQL